jgi:hypothetical protein
LGIRPDYAVDRAIVVTQALKLELRAHCDEQTLICGSTWGGRS